MQMVKRLERHTSKHRTLRHLPNRATALMKFYDIRTLVGPRGLKSTAQAKAKHLLYRVGRLACLVLVLILLSSGCSKDSNSTPTVKQIVVYYSVDDVFARRVFDAFEAQSDVKLLRVGDSEAGKTTGLVNKITQEARSGRPRADVFWSSELFNTIQMAKQGLFEAYDSPVAVDIPKRFRDRNHFWTATSVRGRVLAFDPTSHQFESLPSRWDELANTPYVGHFALANPIFGTTRSHVAAMFALWGDDKAKAFLRKLRSGGAKIVASNSQTVRAVMDGSAKFAATDTDDVWLAKKSGASIDLKYLDMGDGGTLLIPCSVAIVKGGPNPANAKKLVDFLVSAKVERMLAQSDSHNIPVRQALRTELGVSWPPETKVSFDAIAGAMDRAIAAVREILLR